MKNKVLIISHNPIGDNDNVGITLRNLFSGFKKEELCQLYLRDQDCNFDVCGEYYCFKETSILKSLVKRNAETGIVKTHNVISNEETVIDNDKGSGLKDFIYELGRKRTQLIFSLRNGVWRYSNWYSKELKDWLRIERPSVIFFCTGDYAFLFEIVEKIAKDLNIPVVTYSVDDYYFVKETKEKLFHIDSKDYKRAYKCIYDLAKVNFCLSESMAKRYSEEFGKKAYPLMNSVTPLDCVDEYKLPQNVKVRYFGNIDFNRYDSLGRLAEVLAKLNQNNNRQFDFEIYSGESNKARIAELTKFKAVNFKGRISPSEVEKEIANSDILVVAESFDKVNRETVRYSVSTKIPASLNSGKLILAIGPNDVEAINYLKRNHAAFVLDDLDNLEKDCAKLYEDIDVNDIIKNAHELVIKNHDVNMNQIKLRNALYENIGD